MAYNGWCLCRANHLLSITAKTSPHGTNTLLPCRFCGAISKTMFKWIKLIRFIKKHRARGIASFSVVTNSDTFIITTEDCEQTEASWKENMLRIPYN